MKDRLCTPKDRLCIPGRGGRRSLALLLFGALVSCSEGTTGPDASGDVRVNFFAGTGGALAAIAPSFAVGQASGAVQSVDVQRVAVVFGGVKLETAGVDETVDWSLEESRVVELDLEGGPVAAAGYDVDPGTYKEVEVSIDKLEEGNPAEEPLIDEHPELRNASVVAEGVVVGDDGSSVPFTWATDLDADLEVLLESFLTIEDAGPGEAAPTVIAVVVHVDRWFDDGSGGLLDPTDAANRSAIESNVAASIEAFEDPDADGVEAP